MQDVVVLEEIGVLQHDIGPLGDDFLPVLAARIGNRRFHQPEVTAGIVDAEIEKVAIMVGIVFDALLARFHHLPHAQRLVAEMYCTSLVVALAETKEM